MNNYIRYKLLVKITNTQLTLTVKLLKFGYIIYFDLYPTQYIYICILCITQDIIDVKRQNILSDWYMYVLLWLLRQKGKIMAR